MENRFLGLIEKSVKKHWDLPAFTDYDGTTFTFGDFAREMARFHILLEHAGIQKGDKVAIVGRNSSAWAITFFGTLSYGAVAVPILHDFKADNIHHIINHAEAKAVFVAADNWKEMSGDAISAVRLIVLLDNAAILRGVTPSADVDALFGQRYPQGFTPKAVAFHVEEPEELAVLNYTSGTADFSKGVMLPYRSLWSNTQFACDRLPFIHAGDNIVCMLPMAHAYGLAFEVLNSVNKGCHVHFLGRTPSPQIVASALARIRPTLILAVPLIMEKIVQNNIFPELKKPLFRLLLKVPLLDRLLLRVIAGKLTQSLGGNLSEVVIGGAALNKEVEMFLHRSGFRYTVGYGMTECGPLITYEQWDTFKPRSVGRVVDRMEIAIDSNDVANTAGEIMVRGMNVMLGYYKNPEATDAVMMDNGWMRTGDLGVRDADGFLYIRGRSKSLILSSNGQNIYPEELEEKLNRMPYVAESLVVSDGNKMTALIVPDLKQTASDNITSDNLLRLMQENLLQLNREVPSYSKVHCFVIRKEEFEKTPKRSIKRYLYQSKPNK